MNIDKRVEEETKRLAELKETRAEVKPQLKKFGERLTYWREERRFTRRELAERIKEESGLTLSRSMISYYESGNRMPYPEMLDAILSALDVSAAHLLGPDGPARESVVGMYEIIREMSPERQAAMIQIYEGQKKRRQEQKKEEERRLKEEAQAMKYIFGLTDKNPGV